MKSSLLAAAAALAVFAIAPVAQAQASCEDLAAIVAEVELDFEDILGEELDEDYYASTLVLPGARECAVLFDWDSVYTCIWQVPDEASARRIVDTQVATLRGCFNDSWKQKAISDQRTDGWRLLGGSTFSTLDEDVELRFISRADASRGTPEVYEVELSLLYVWF